MSCARYGDAILEHALGEPAQPELDAHLLSCDACREALQRERRLIGRIDGELREAVSTAPSPAFLSRVRERVASEAIASRSRTLYVLLPVAASVIVLIAASSLIHRAPFPPQVVRATAAAAPALPPPRAVASATPVAPTTATRIAPQHIERRQLDRRAAPEILVSPSEEAALLRFMAALRTGRVDATTIAAAGPRPVELQDLTIAPLEVKPLTTDTPTEGVEHDH